MSYSCPYCGDTDNVKEYRPTPETLLFLCNDCGLECKRKDDES